jgi:hypothetical protein
MKLVCFFLFKKNFFYFLAGLDTHDVGGYPEVKFTALIRKNNKKPRLD